MKRIVPLFLLVFLSGCTHTIERPYVYISDGIYAYEDKVWDHGVIRDRLPTDKQALQFVTDENGTSLTRGELVYYHGTLYSLSNYREKLLQEGYKIENYVRTCDLLDTVLSRDADRVRLIYQRSGLIRILFENQEGPAHILLEGIK